MPYAAAALLIVPLFISSVADAKITKIIIEKREVFANVTSFRSRALTRSWPARLTAS